MKNIKLSVVSESNLKYEIDYHLTDHALKRSLCRSIDLASIGICLLYGKPIFKQGITFYYVQKRLLPEDILRGKIAKLKDLVVVCDDNTGTIITTYRCSKGNIHIRKKCKELVNYAA